MPHCQLWVHLPLCLLSLSLCILAGLSETPMLPSSLMLLNTAHEYLGRRSWCCNSDGALLRFYVSVPFVLHTGTPRAALPGCCVVQKCSCRGGHSHVIAFGFGCLTTYHGAFYAAWSFCVYVTIETCQKLRTWVPSES